MKILKKILCGLALGTMAVGVGIGIKGNNAKVVKADGNSIETVASVLNITAGYNGHEKPNEAYIVLGLTENDYPTTLENPSFNGSNSNYVSGEYNFLNKIYFSEDRTNWVPAADHVGGSFYLTSGNALGNGANFRIQLSPFSGDDFKSCLTRWVKIESGCEFPSYEHIGSGQSGELKKYVTSSDVIFDSYFVEDDGSKSCFRDYAKSIETTVSAFVTGESNTVWLRTTVNDYFDNCNHKIDDENYSHANKPVYDYQKLNTIHNIKFNETSIKEKGSVGMSFDKFTRPCLAIDMGDGSGFNGLESVTIPAFTQFPAFSTSHPSDEYGKEKIIYCTTEDVVLDTPVAEAGTAETSRQGYAWHKSIPVTINNVTIENPNDVNAFVTFAMSNSDYPANKQTVLVHESNNNVLATNYLQYLTPSVISKIKLNNEPLVLSGTSLLANCEPFMNMFGRFNNSFSFRRGGNFLLNTIEIGAGTVFPSHVYTSSNCNSTPTVFKVAADAKFNCENAAEPKNFFKEETLPLTLSDDPLNVDLVRLRGDASGAFLQICISNSDRGYDNLANNSVQSILNYLSKINFFNYIKIHFYDGTVHTITSADVLKFTMHQWGDPTVFIRLDENVLPRTKLGYAQYVELCKGLELPNFDGSLKYALSETVCFGKENGSLYKNNNEQKLENEAGSFKPWDIFGPTDNFMRELSMRFTLTKDGNVKLTPKVVSQTDVLFLDSDSNIVFNENTGLHYTALFSLNTFSKISIHEKNGTTKKLSEFRYADDLYGNIFSNGEHGYGFRPRIDAEKTSAFNIGDYDEITIEAGCQMPINNTYKNEVHYLEVAETITYYLNNKGDFGLPVNVTFNGGDPVSVITGGTIPNMPAAPTKTGDAEFSYTGFWKDGDGNEVTADTIVTGAMDLVSDFKSARVSYSLSYLDENEQAISGLGGTTANASEVTLPAVPAKTGYTGHWESTDVTLEGETFVMPTKDVAIKAVYVANTYELSFDGLQDTLSVTYGQPVGTLPAVPAKTGYHDGKWMIGEDELTASTVWNFTEDKEAVAEYVIDTHTVTFDSNGGSAVEGATVNYGGKVIRPADPSRVGYTFLGWFNGDTAYNFDAEVTEDLTLTGRWEVVKLTVTFNSNGGSAIAAATVDYGAKVAKPADPTKEGFTFKGWFNGEAEFDFNTELTSNVTLVAKWEEVPAGDKDDDNKPAASTGCGGSIIAGSAIITLVSALGVCLLSSKKKED